MSSRTAAPVAAPHPPARHGVALEGVAETLLIPPYARAWASRWTPPLLVDPAAQKIVNSLDYDFARVDRSFALIPIAIRAALYDRLLRAHLEREPDATVVEIGAGLSTHSLRLDNGRARWIEFDLPEAVEVRRRHVPEGPRRTIAAASFLDPSWLDLVPRSGPPPVFVAEAVLYLLPQAGVARALAAAAEAFPGAIFYFDTVSRATVARAHRGILRRLSARMQWGCDHPSELAAWAPQCELLESHNVLDLSPADWRSLPWKFRTVVGLGKRIAPRKFDALRIHKFRLRPAPARALPPPLFSRHPYDQKWRWRPSPGHHRPRATSPARGRKPEKAATAPPLRAGRALPPPRSGRLRRSSSGLATSLRQRRSARAVFKNQARKPIGVAGTP